MLNSNWKNYLNSKALWNHYRNSSRNYHRKTSISRSIKKCLSPNRKSYLSLKDRVSWETNLLDNYINSCWNIYRKDRFRGKNHWNWKTDRNNCWKTYLKYHWGTFRDYCWEILWKRSWKNCLGWSADRKNYRSGENHHSDLTVWSNCWKRKDCSNR